MPVPEEKRGDHVLEMITQVHTLTIAHGGTLAHIQETQERHGYVIDGNGKEGLLTRLAVIEEKMARLEEDRLAVDSMKHIRWEVVGAGVALAASILAFTMQIWGA